MKIKRTGSVSWTGAVKDGRGAITTQSGALSAYPYGFSSRFEGQPGSNPEELLGAAHAACFTMATSLILGQQGFTPERLDTRAEVTLEQVETGFAITAIHLTIEGHVPKIDASTFDAIAKQAKENCPVSKALSVPITLEIKLA